MNHSIALGVGGACVIIWIFCTLGKTNSMSQNLIRFDSLDSCVCEERDSMLMCLPHTFWLWIATFLTMSESKCGTIFLILSHPWLACSYLYMPFTFFFFYYYHYCYIQRMWFSATPASLRQALKEKKKKWVQRLNQALSLAFKSTLFGPNLQGFKALSL